jgi:hypothetical protein
MEEAKLPFPFGLITLRCAFIQIKQVDITLIGQSGWERGEGNFGIIQYLFGEILICLWMHNKLTPRSATLPGNLWLSDPTRLIKSAQQRAQRAIFTPPSGASERAIQLSERN